MCIRDRVNSVREVSYFRVAIYSKSVTLETSNLSDYQRSVMKPAQKLLRIRLRLDTRALVTIYKIAVCRLNSRMFGKNLHKHVSKARVI